MSLTLDLERQATEAASSLPALLADAETLAATLAAGAHGRRRAGSGETFWQYRDYTSHDSAASIDWRQSARAPARLFVRETEWETAATIRLWCARSDSLQYGSASVTKRWRAQVLTTALALLLTKSGEKISLMPGATPAMGGQRAVMTVAETLLGPFENKDDLPALPPTGTTQAVYISDFHLDIERLEGRLKEIAAIGIPLHLVAVSDPAEEAFPFKGRMLFEDPGSSASRKLLGDAGRVAEDYRRRRTAHFGVIEDICRQFGMTFLRHRTDHPAALVLSQLHDSISGHHH